MSLRVTRVIPHVVVSGSIIAVATGLVAVRIVSAPGMSGFLFFSNVAYWMLWTALAPAALLLGARFRFVAGAWPRALAIHAAASLAFAAAHLAAVTVIAAALRAGFLAQPFSVSLAQLRVPMRIHVEWEITMYWAIVGLAHAITFRADAQERELRAAQLEARLVQSQLQALQRQLQPHFLFNSLHTIAALVHRDVNAADAMIERLGDLLRMTLAAGDEPEASLARELEHVRNYVAIERANMGERLAVTVDAAPDTLAAGVPALLLQPLVENAVRHGLAPRASGGRVRITAARAGADLAIAVQDDGIGWKDGIKPAGIGLENTRQRLLQMYGSRHQFTITSPDEGGVCVSIRMPFRAVQVAAIGAGR